MSTAPRWAPRRALSPEGVLCGGGEGTACLPGNLAGEPACKKAAGRQGEDESPAEVCEKAAGARSLEDLGGGQGSVREGTESSLGHMGKQAFWM